MIICHTHQTKERYQQQQQNCLNNQHFVTVYITKASKCIRRIYL